MTVRAWLMAAALVVAVPATPAALPEWPRFAVLENFDSVPQQAEVRGGFDLALIAIGGYEPRWFMRHQHQDPDEAVEGFRLSGTAHAVGHHCGTFQLTNEPVTEPRDRLHAALDKAGIARERFRALLPGEAFDVPEAAETA